MPPYHRGRIDIIGTDAEEWQGRPKVVMGVLQYKRQSGRGNWRTEPTGHQRSKTLIRQSALAPCRSAEYYCRPRISRIERFRHAMVPSDSRQTDHWIKPPNVRVCFPASDRTRSPP